jgi:hypothetical protein
VRPLYEVIAGRGDHERRNVIEFKHIPCPIDFADTVLIVRA